MSRAARPGVPADREVLPLALPGGLDAAELEFEGGVYVVLTLPIRGADDPTFWSLTATERAVASAASAGLSNAEIAGERGVAIRTVANQLGAIYRKLGLHSRAELAAYLQGARPTGVELEDHAARREGPSTK